VPLSGQTWNVEFLTTSPILTPFSPLLKAWRTRPEWPSLDEFTQFADEQRLLRAPAASPIRFAPAEPKRTRSRRDAVLELSRLYDGRIALRSEVSCLEHSYHDLFNVLAWAAFPNAKRALHQRQFRALEQWLPPGASRLPNRRTREQDALTVFDEGGSVLVTSLPDLEKRETPLRLVPGPDIAFVVFGHALMEHVAYGRERVRSAALLLPARESVPSGLELFELIDQGVTARLLDPHAFAAPGVDGVVEIDADGGLWFNR
jgi:Protein of unknown function (DUF3025)